MSIGAPLSRVHLTDRSNLTIRTYPDVLLYSPMLRGNENQRLRITFLSREFKGRQMQHLSQAHNQPSQRNSMEVCAHASLQSIISDGSESS